MSLQPSEPVQDSVMAQDESMRDDSSARKYNKTSSQKRAAQDNPSLDAAGSSSRAQFVPGGDGGLPYDPVAEYRRGRALTADNLGRIPDADQLAPGIRLPGRTIDSHGADTDMQTSSDADEGAQSLETGHTSVGAFGEGGAPVPGVPPELDPRTPAFRPHSPGEASVFSVAVQPPASPKASILEASEPASPFVETTPSRSDRYGIPASSASATAGSSSYSHSARGSSPPLSAGYAPSEALNAALRLGPGPGPSMLGRNVASVAPSEAGSVSSSGTGGGGPGSTGTADDQEVALRAAYIERQRMRERELMGGEAGVGGTTIPTFPLSARGTTPLAFAPGLSARLGGGSGNTPFDNVSRAGSTAATTGTSTPPLSPTGSEIPDAVASPSRRGSVDSTETLGSIRAPPSVQGFEPGSGIESRRMSRGGSSAGYGDATQHDYGRRGSEGGLINTAMEEDEQMGNEVRREPEAL